MEKQNMKAALSDLCVNSNPAKYVAVRPCTSLAVNPLDMKSVC